MPDDRDPKFSYLTRMSASIAVVNDSLKCVTSRRKYYSVTDTDNALVYDGTKCGDDQVGTMYFMPVFLSNKTCSFIKNYSKMLYFYSFKELWCTEILPIV